MWNLYEDLLRPIPEGIVVERAILGATWSFVLAKKEKEEYFGIASSILLPGPSQEKLNWSGADLKDLAAKIKSWNFKEASLALAAINAFYQSKENIENIKNNSDYQLISDQDAFLAYKSQAENKKIAFIGHFHSLENYLDKDSDLIVLEKEPKTGDYPDSAAEFLLADRNIVFITASTLINKTLPRLLELTKHAKVILSGPSSPLTPILFEYGIKESSGFIIENHEKAAKIIASGEHKRVFQQGQKVRLLKSNK